VLVAVDEDAQLDALGNLAEEREVGARPIEGRAEREGLSGPSFHGPTLTRVGRFDRLDRDHSGSNAAKQAANGAERQEPLLTASSIASRNTRSPSEITTG
jgi:hypothetical protein